MAPLLTLLFLTAPVVISVTKEGPPRQPQLAIQENIVDLAFGAGKSIFFSQSRDAGAAFETPVQIATAEKMDLGRHRGPRVVRTNGKDIVTAVITDPASGFRGDLVAWSSGDNGKHWSKPVRINDAAGAAEEGLHGLASDGNGLVVATWLDHRSLQAKVKGAGPELWAAVSRDGGATWSTNVLAYRSPSGSICSCCHPNATFTAGGRIVLMFRNALNGERDEYVVESRDGGKTFVQAAKLGRGAWRLEACPMDGGGVAAAAGDGVISVWRREQTIFAAKPGTEERRLGEGKDASLAAQGGRMWVAWTAPAGVVLSEPDRAEPVLLDAHGGFAQVRLLKNGKPLVAWESPDGIKVEAF